MTDRLQIGEVVGGKYRLEQVIGHGGFATVFQAVDITLDRDVAVKMLNPGEQGYDRTLSGRFRREAKLVSRLNDPHTVRMYDFGETPSGVLYMVFEMLGGEDLSSRLQRGAMPQAEAEHVLRQLLASLREAHSHGLLHRDVKPANIRIFRHRDDPNYAKLMDFGMARDAGGDGRVTRTGALVGTPRYMSPEQFTGEQLTPASDLFSLGLVALEMLTGEPAPRQDVILGKRINIPAAGPLAAMLDQMLVPDADERVQSVEDALAILDGSAAGPAIAPKPRPQTPVSAAPSPQPGHARAILVGAGFGLIVVGLAAAYIVRSLTPDEPPPPMMPRRLPTPPVASVNVAPPVIATDVGVPEDVANAVDPPDAGPITGCGNEDYFAKPGKKTPLAAYVGVGEHPYTLVLPKTYDPKKPFGLLLAFHDVGRTNRRVLQTIHAKQTAEQHNVIIAAPGDDAINPWRSPQIAAVVRQIVEDIKREYCVDEGRIFVLGNGRGGRAVDRLMCEDWVTAYATMGYRMLTNNFICKPADPAPYLHLAPLKSAHLPLEGGQDCVYQTRSIPLRRHDEVWVERNRCDREPRVQRVKSSTCMIYDCAAPFVSCHLDGGLPWPGGEPRDVDLLNCDGPPADFPLESRLWRFFDEASKWKRSL